MDADVLLVITNLPDRAGAEKMAALLVEESLAACVNILAPCRSVYRWQGAVQREEEHPLLIKTTQARYAALQAAIRQAHPYSVPEIIALPVVAGLPDYLAWVVHETAHQAEQPAGQQAERTSMQGEAP